ncbi:immunoglobulin A1 protease autotransporter-like isoform X2 [Siniperca chuatsi]|uniref:immunoglobulin A1 protease autotransporter-like isoform X2 n=1 Tax=Siniperca chuatsi TaxID=119488 RepID=UPI001CE13796|nr:immunoglobulin A1 protease autotransporter-like isoform X2 [Siniperca chuatsi]
MPPAQDRKSLRDQWLMEGAPLSATSLDAQSPRSPLWGSHAQEIEKRIDKLQSENQRLAEEEEKLKEQMEDGQMESVKVAEAKAEIVQDAVVQNGENNATGLEITKDEVKTNQSHLLDETAAVLTNGRGDLQANTSHDASEQSNQSTTNGPVVPSEGVVILKLDPGLSLGVSEAQPGQVPNANINEEEEEGTLVMRAECIFITDEGDDVPEDRTPQEDQQETMQLEETPLPNPEAGKEGVEAVEEVVKTEATPESFTQPEKSEATEPAAQAQPPTGDGDMQDGVKTNKNEDGQTDAEGQDKQSEDPTSVQVQSQASALEGTTVAPVPFYPEVRSSALTSKLEVVAESATTPEGAEAALKAEDPATLPDQFQEVPLADPQENQRTEAGSWEQEPLLSQAKAPDTQAEPAAANSPAGTETHSPARANQGEETGAPKRKTCRCCSVM